MDANVNLYVDDKPVAEATKYPWIIGALQCLALTCLDISYAVNKLSQFVVDPKEIHYKSMKRILRYLSNLHW